MGSLGVAKMVAAGGVPNTSALNEYSDHEVHLYDADSRPGGHANTVPFTNPQNGETTMVDTGFIVFNPPTYPNFHRFLKLVGIKTIDTEMTFALTRDNGAFEWAGDTLFTLFCQPGNLFKGSMWRMIWDILRFNASARRLVIEAEQDAEGKDAMSIGEYLDRNGYSAEFRDDYLIIFLARHIEYVSRVTSKLPSGALRLGKPVVSVTTARSEEGAFPKVILRTADGQSEEYDRVVLACHSGTALQILENGGGATPEEKSILGGFGWTQNRIVLHSDISALPKHRSAWSAWNYVTESEHTEKGTTKKNSDKFALSCKWHWIDASPHMERYGPIICTLNPTFPIDKSSIQAHAQYEHPTFNAAAERSQRAMPQIQNTRGLLYAGAWMANGFHEDGFRVGLQAAVSIGDVKLPFDIRPPDRRVEALWTADVFDVLERVRRVLSRFWLALLFVVGIMV
ncbi:hypothetical protein M408DRAFT_28417 [Serendipita vermifera MAFF 305830]|uniref:Amine oxidase domain-containing protein n=1 Tax=Serendipita vermifera MAFF 305830 TaxID=933852 RepID=A0A0C3ADQ0_SERVB|nr:hypothetical protein M408DRAFT_28417 [Serendipita vermifera MAFF 305830]